MTFSRGDSWSRTTQSVRHSFLVLSIGLILAIQQYGQAQQPFIIDFINAGATGPIDAGGNDDLNSFSAGYEFTVGAADISVTDLGYYSPLEELLDDHDVAIYDVDDPSVPVVVATIEAGGTTDDVPSSADGGLDPGGFRYTPVSPPVVLTAGSTYRIAGYNDGTVEGFNFASNALVTGTEAAFGTPAGDPGAVGIDYPDEVVPIGIPGCCIGPNFKYTTAAAEPVPDGDRLWSVDIQGGPAGGAFGQFGDPEDKSGFDPIYGYGNVWNQFNVQGFDNATTESSPSMDLVDANGNESPVSFSIEGDVQGWAGNNAWSGFLNQIIPAEGSASELSLTGDYLFLNAGQSAQSITWAITGLEPGAAYELYVYASVVGDEANRQLGFEVDQSGDSAIIDEPGRLFQSIVANPDGAITGTAGLPIAAEQNWAGFQLRMLSLQGDYNGNGVLDANDIDLLSMAALEEDPDLRFDEDGNGTVDENDRQIWIQQYARTWTGDANLDQEFNSADLVQVFSVGKYETGAAAGWAEGDWDGDQVFGSGDLVAAFTDGGFEIGPRTAATVPEPQAATLIIMMLLGLSLARANGRIVLQRQIR